MNTINKYMFREYDIRGRESDEVLNGDSITLIVKAFGTLLRKQNITQEVVGNDNRKSSEDFYQATTKALRSTGVDVIGIGICLTPMIYWAPYHFKVKGGLMITASHNPAGWNGLKMGDDYSKTLDNTQIKEVLHIAESGEFASGQGSLREENIAKLYVEDILSRAKLNRKLKVVINTAHGGVPIMSPTGYMYVKERLKSEGGSFGGEQSGHTFFVDEYYGFDDANFAGLKLLEYLSSLSEPLSKIVEATPYYISTPALHAHVPDDVKYDIVKKLTEEFKSEGYRVIDINGARVYLLSGWGLVRASSNLPALVLRFEAKTQEDLDKIQKIFKEKLKKYPEVAETWESAKKTVGYKKNEREVCGEQAFALFELGPEPKWMAAVRRRTT